MTSDAYSNRMTEMIAYCPFHVGVGFPAYHVRTDSGERIYQCSQCGQEFLERSQAEVDTR